jgi:hypothetical protein
VIDAALTPESRVAAELPSSTEQSLLVETAVGQISPVVEPVSAGERAAGVESVPQGESDAGSAVHPSVAVSDPAAVPGQVLAPDGRPRLGAADIEWKAVRRVVAAAPARGEAAGVEVAGVEVAGVEVAGRASAGLRDSGVDVGSIEGETVDRARAAVPKRGFARRWVLPVFVGLVAAFVAGTGYLAVTEPQTARDLGRWGATADPAGAAATVSQEPADFGVESGNADPFAALAPVLTGAPTRLRVAAIGVDTSLESLYLGKGGALTPPKNFAKAGWYADGTAPGDQGPAVIAGHVDSQRGPAVFYKLREIQTGDEIEVIRGGKSVRFTVVSTAWYPKTKFPTDQVYGPTPDRQLRLITCGGVFDHRLRSYKDNLVVYAVAG